MSEDAGYLRTLVDDYIQARLSRRQFMIRALALGVSASAAGAILAACTSTSSSSGSTTPKVGGIIKHGTDRDFSRIDPINTDWGGEPFQAIYETLVTKDPGGNFVPMMAESWQTSSDGKTITFKIRSGMKFQSGAPCDAAAIAKALNVMRDPTAGNPNLGFWTPITDVSAQGSNVVIALSHPDFDLLNVLNNPYAAIPNIATRDQLGKTYGSQGADGSGAFKFSEFVPGSHVTVKRFENYPGSIVPFFTNKGKPYLDGIQWVAQLDPGTRANEIEAGTVDAILHPAPQDVDRLKSNKNLTVIEFPQNGLFFLKLNWRLANPGFSDLSLRQAISYAIDRQSIVDHVLFGHGVPGYSLLSKGMAYYNPAVEQYNHFDAAKSQSLLDQAGWKVGSDGIRVKNGQRLSFEMTLPTQADHEAVAQALQAMLKNVGIEVKLDAREFNAYIAKVYGPTHEITSLNFYLWPNPFDVASLFTGTGLVPNTGSATVPELDAAFAKWQSATSEADLKAAADQAQVIAAQTLPMIPIATPSNVWVRRNNVHGYQPFIYNLWVYFNDVWLG